MLSFIRQTLLESWDFFHDNFGAMCRVLWPFLALLGVVSMVPFFIKYQGMSLLDMVDYVRYQGHAAMAKGFAGFFVPIFCMKGIYVLKTARPISLQEMILWTRQDTACLWRVLVTGLILMPVVSFPQILLLFDVSLTQGMDYETFKVYSAIGDGILQLITSCLSALLVLYPVSAYSQKSFSLIEAVKHLKGRMISLTLIMVGLRFFSRGIHNGLSFVFKSNPFLESVTHIGWNLLYAQLFLTVISVVVFCNIVPEKR